MLTYIHKDKKLFENTKTKYQENWGKEKVVTQNITKQRQKKSSHQILRKILENTQGDPFIALVK